MRESSTIMIGHRRSNSLQQSLRYAYRIDQATLKSDSLRESGSIYLLFEQRRQIPPMVKADPPVDETLRLHDRGRVPASMTPSLENS